MAIPRNGIISDVYESANIRKYLDSDVFTDGKKSHLTISLNMSELNKDEKKAIATLLKSTSRLLSHLQKSPGFQQFVKESRQSKGEANSNSKTK